MSLHIRTFVILVEKEITTKKTVKNKQRDHTPVVNMLPYVLFSFIKFCFSSSLF